MQELDNVYVEIGELGIGQLGVCAALYLSYVYGAWHVLQLVFTGHQAKFRCNDPGYENATLPGDLTDEEWNERMCAMVDVPNCTNVTFEDDHSSIVTEWHLICAQAYKVSLCEALFMTGIFLGSYTTGSLSDHIGRRKSMFLCLLLGAVFTSASSFSPNYVAYAALRMVSGVFLAGLQLITFVNLTEIVGGSKRALCGTVFESALGVSTILMAVAAYFIKDWRNLTLITSAIGFLLIPLYFCIPESPRWFIIKGRYEDAEKVFRYIARRNGRSYTPIDLSLCTQNGNPRTKSAGVDDDGNNNRIVTLFRHAVLRNRTLIMMYAWFCVLGTYYGLSMVAEDLRSSIYMNEFLLCLVEMPGLVIAVVLMYKLGRKWSTCLSMLVAGVSCLVIFLIPHFSRHITHAAVLELRTGLALFGKMAVTIAMATSFIHTSELMPTMIRNSGLGLCTMMGRLGSIGAPFIAKLGFYYPHLEYIVFGVMAVSAGSLCLFLPETLNRPMPDTIEDALGQDAPLLWHKRERRRWGQANGTGVSGVRAGSASINDDPEPVTVYGT